HHFSCTPPPTTQLSSLSLHDALPIYSVRAVLGHRRPPRRGRDPGGARGVLRPGWRPACARGADGDRRTRRSCCAAAGFRGLRSRSEEHTSELQSRENLVCRLLLEKEK